MTIFLIAAAILWILTRTDMTNKQATQPTVTFSGQSTTDFLPSSKGVALSAALGTTNPGPGHFQSGNPGFNPASAAGRVGTSPSTNPVVSSGTSLSSERTTLGAVYPAVPKTTSGGFQGQPVHGNVAPGNAARVGKVNVPQKSPINRAGTFNPALANRPIVVVRNSPEATSTFFGNKVVVIKRPTNKPSGANAAHAWRGNAPKAKLS